jgi:hypothetical protein
LPTFVQNMRVNHGCGNVLVAEKLLDSSNIVTGFQQMRGKSMPEGMATNMLHYARFDNSLLDRALENGFIFI